MGKIQKGPTKLSHKARCYTTSIKSPLLHGTSKSRCYTAPLKILLLHDTSKSPLLHGNIFTKVYKAQILFWQYFTKPKY